MIEQAIYKSYEWQKMMVLAASFIALSSLFIPVELRANDEYSKPIHVVFAPMQPVFQVPAALPKSKPDPALAYPLKPVSIILPVPKPALSDILPESTATVSEMIRVQTNTNAGTETQLTLQAGEGVAALLHRAGYDSASIVAAVDAVADKASLRRLRIGTKFQVTDKGFRFSIKPGQDIFVIYYGKSGWIALTALRPTESYITFFQGSIDGSIYKAAMAAGVSEAAFNEYVRILGFSVDFQRDIRNGDSFELLYETDRDSFSGKFISGRLHYAGLVLSNENLGFFRYNGANNITSWYDENGNSAARTLIRTPISGARLSSSFGRRKHPVSGFNAMHKGVDFAAPYGTPIIAAGSGLVKEAGWKGSFGRYIRIRHNATYDTAYAHLQRLAPNIHNGSRVKQGEVIGYVGSTGKSTGAHLHYEVMVNNRQVNPMTVSLPNGQRIDEKHLLAFRKTVASIDRELLSHGTVRFASKDNFNTNR
ncbi:peptidoglycan DD-metalloendopeptidase family protein [Candidatus Puniceispirillum sp.]|nr:peptidoglycan DD-metalloendopeptidase family protein [Candidatus Puniceispirillum sp.]